jgi:signal transduction histidine kinase
MGSDQAAGPDLSDAERARLVDELAIGARRGAIARFASSISHALGTPLNVIAGRAAMIGMSERLDANEIRQNAQIIEAQVRNISDLLQRALAFARAGAPEPNPTDLRALAGSIVALLRPLAGARQVGVELAAGPALSASVHESRLRDVLAVLVSWAVGCMEPGTELTVAVERAETVKPPPGERGRARGGPSVLFRIHCPGVRLPVEALEHVYEPWLAAAGGDRDAAIALAFAFGIAREHRGFVEAVGDDAATSFVICWPI